MTKTKQDTEQDAAPAVDADGVEQDGGHVFYAPVEATQPFDVNALHASAPAEGE